MALLGSRSPTLESYAYYCTYRIDYRPRDSFPVSGPLHLVDRRRVFVGLPCYAFKEPVSPLMTSQALYANLTPLPVPAGYYRAGILLRG